MNTQITLPCMNGFTLQATEGNIVILSKRTSETIPISKIQSFTLKEPHGISTGSIVLNTSQAASTEVRLGLGVSAAIGAERTFFFTKANLSTAQQFHNYVTTYETKQSSDNFSLPEGKVVSVVDEIRGLKGLLDDGIITQAEFDAKKSQLLGI